MEYPETMLAQSKSKQLLLLALAVLAVAGGALYVARNFELGIVRDVRGQIGEIFREFRFQPAKPSNEAWYNPYGESWAMSEGPNRDIPVALTSGCYYEGPRSSQVSVTDAEIDFLSKSNSPIVFELCAVVQDDAPKIREMGQKLRQKDPGLIYTGYYVLPTLGVATHFPGRVQTGFDDLDRNHEECFVHRKGTPVARDNRVEGTGGDYILNVVDQSCRQLVASSIVGSMRGHFMRGVLFDGVMPTADPYASSPDLLPDELRTGWQAGLIALLAEIKRQGPELLLFVNPYRDLKFSEQLLRYADGQMLEEPFGEPLKSGYIPDMNAGSATRKTIDDVLDLAQRMNKYVLMAANVGSDTSTNLEGEQDIERYYLSAFLNFFRNDKTVLLYYSPVRQSSLISWMSEAFFTDWNLRIGQPVSPAEQVGSNVFLRRFKRGIVYWNGNNVPFQVDLAPGQSALTVDAERVNRYSLMPRSGMIFVTGDVLPERNPSFETVWNWKPNVAGWGNTERTNSFVRSGRQSLHLTPGIQYSGLRQQYDFAANTEYEWSGWIKTRNNTGPGIVAAGVPTGAVTPHQVAIGGDTAYITADILPTGTNDWTRLTVRFSTVRGGPGYYYAVVNRTTDGDIWFDDVSLAAIGPGRTYESPPPLGAVRDSVCSGVDIPSIMEPGKAYTISIKFTNTGTGAWSQPDFDLSAPQTDWGTNFAELPQGSVQPGQSVVFRLDVAAPQGPGTYSLRYRLLEQNVEWFGQECGHDVTVRDLGSATSFVSTTTATATTTAPTTTVPGSATPATTTATATTTAPTTTVPGSATPATTTGAQGLSVARLTLTLKRGSENNEVKLLQTLLAKDPAIYPEGSVLGYFGPATERAIQRFQKKHGIVSEGTPSTTGYGMVGAKTRAKLNEVYKGVASPATSPASAPADDAAMRAKLQSQIDELQKILNDLLKKAGINSSLNYNPSEDIFV